MLLGAHTVQFLLLDVLQNQKVEVLAVRTIVELFRMVKREKELHRLLVKPEWSSARREYTGRVCS